ncbi:MAG: hypothetical protein R3B06_27665 [Kofleriaceae bacterium]
MTKHLAVVTLLAGIVACRSTPGSVGAATTAAAPAARTGPPCPAPAELTGLARVAWGQPDAADVEVACVAARLGGGPAWVVYGLARDIPSDDGGETNARHTAVVTAAPPHAVIAASIEDELSFTDVDYGERPTYQAADLDGDGTDELVTTLEASPRGVFTTTLAITTVAGDELAVSEGIPIGYDDSASDAEPPGPTSCAADLRVVPDPDGRGQLIEVTASAATGDPDVAGACLSAGVHRFRYVDGALRPQ